MNKVVAEFVNRSECINCGSCNLNILSGGSYNDDPVNSFIANDPWAESPLPYIQHGNWEFVRCGDCEQMFHKFILSPKWIEKCYSEWISHEAIQEFESINLKPGWKLEKGKNYPDVQPL